MGETLNGAHAGLHRPAPVVVAIVALLVAVGVVVTAGSAPQPMSARVDGVAQGLRCPTCDAESVAASNTPIAQSMRVQIRTQLGQGRSPAQIRTWFENRYGEQVLLVPPARGPSLLLWTLPVLALAAGGLAWAAAARRHPRETGRRTRPAALSPGKVAAAGAALLVVGGGVPAAVWAIDARSPAAAEAGSSTSSISGAPRSSTDTATASTSGPRGGRQDWNSRGQSLEDKHEYAAAANAYRRALRQSPGSAAIRTRLAFDLLRSGRPDAAVPVVSPVARKPGSYRPLALLVLGLAQRQDGSPRSDATLSTFLKVAPEHPAAGQVRRLLAGRR